MSRLKCLLCLGICLLMLPFSACGQAQTENENKTENNLSETNGSNEKTEESSESATEIETELTVKVEEEGDLANVTASNGFKYTAKNYSALNGNSFVFNQELEIVFPEGILEGEFNRVNFEYSSTEPLKVFVYYTLDGSVTEDYFFLDAKEGNFYGLISAYLDGKKAVGIEKIVFNTCKKVEGELTLLNVSNETIPLYEDDLCIENDRFKIGVRLSWGGSMTYYEDKNDGSKKLENLVNIHDTGRVIQQSFYGTRGNEEYVPGSYNDSNAWPYNPVQAGNKFESSRPHLINVEVGEDYIYILAQSLDWALDGVLTYMYYENKYTLKDDYVLVDNVATDYSGWAHDPGGQEIPAVYLISYFDTLCYYNGNKPWTNDADGLNFVENIGGWDESKSCYFARGNDETWAAWINTNKNFAFGIYCPNVDKLIAIRHQYDGTINPMSNATTYVAPSSSITMQPYKPIVYSYMLTSGTPEEVRKVFTDNKDFSTNPSLSEDKFDQRVSLEKLDMTAIDFTDEKTYEILCGKYNTDVKYNGDMGATEFTLLGALDPYVTIDFTQNSDKTLFAENYNTVEFEYMIPVENGRSSYTTTLFLCSGKVKSPAEGYTVTTTLIKDGQYHKALIFLPSDRWSGEIYKIRFDFFHTGVVDDKLYIKNFNLTNMIEISAESDMTVSGSEAVVSSPKQTLVTFDDAEGCVKIASTENNADVSVELAYSKLGLSAEKYKTLVVEYMIPTSNSSRNAQLGLYLCAGDDEGYAGSRYVGASLVVDGEYHTVAITLDGNEGWKGIIKKIRFDYFDGYHNAGDAIYIRSIDLK